MKKLAAILIACCLFQSCLKFEYRIEKVEVVGTDKFYAVYWVNNLKREEIIDSTGLERLMEISEVTFVHLP